MKDKMVLIGVADNRNSVRRWRRCGSEALPSPHGRRAAGAMRFVDYGPSPRYASRMLLMRIKRARSRTSSFWAIMTNCAEAASVDFPEALRHRCDSSPSDEAMGGLFFDFGPIRTTRSPRREHSRERESNLDVVASTASSRDAVLVITRESRRLTGPMPQARGARPVRRVEHDGLEGTGGVS